jgi:hypothetical protein
MLAGRNSSTSNTLILFSIAHSAHKTED